MSLLMLLAVTAAPSVTLDSGACRVPVLLSKLEPIVGKRLRSTAYLEDEVLFVSVKERPVQEVLDGIASVCRSRWEEKSDGLWLSRPAGMINSGKRKEQADHAAAFKKSIDSWLAKQVDFEWSESGFKQKVQSTSKLAEVAQAEALGSLRFSTPVGKLFRKLVPTIDLKPLMAVPFDQPVVFSTNPRRMHLAFPNSATALVAEFLREHDAVIRWLPSEESTAEVAKRLRANFGKYSTPFATPATAMLRFLRTGVDRIHFRLTVYDREGYVVETQMPLVFSREEQKLALPKESDWTKLTLQPSNEARQLVDSFSQRETTPFKGQDRPEDLEPLGYLLNDALRLIAEKSQHDTIARIPDHLALPSIGVYADSYTLESFARRIIAPYCRATVDSGTIIIEPIHPEHAFEVRFRRAALGKLLRVRDVPRLGDIAPYAAAERGAHNDNPLADLVLRLNRIHGGYYLAPLWSHLGRGYLRLYHSLSAIQRRDIVDAGLSLSSLTPQQQLLLQNLVYASSLQGSREPNLTRGNSNGHLNPFFALPDGLPPHSLIRASLGQTQALYFGARQGRGFVLEPGAVAQGFAAREQARQTERQELPGDSLAPVEMTHITLSLEMPSASAIPFQLMDARIIGPQVSNWKSLPNAYARNLEELIQLFRRGPGGG